MRNFALLGASALVLAVGVASASAQPSGESFLTRGDAGVVRNRATSPYRAQIQEGRSAAKESSSPSYDAFIWQMHDGA